MTPLLAQLAATTAFDGDVSYWGLFLKTVVATVFIIVLALLILRYLVPHVHNLRRNRKSRIQVLDYQGLEPRRGIYIVEIAGQKMAVGVSENFIGKICDVPEK